MKVLDLEQQMEALIADNKHIGTILKQLIQALCAEEVGIIQVPSLKTSLMFPQHRLRPVVV